MASTEHCRQLNGDGIPLQVVAVGLVQV